MMSAEGTGAMAWNEPCVLTALPLSRFRAPQGLGSPAPCTKAWQMAGPHRRLKGTCRSSDQAASRAPAWPCPALDRLPPQPCPLVPSTPPCSGPHDALVSSPEAPLPCLLTAPPQAPLPEPPPTSVTKATDTAESHLTTSRHAFTVLEGVCPT